MLPALRATSDPNPNPQPEPEPPTLTPNPSPSPQPEPEPGATSDEQIQAMFEKAQLPADVTAELRRYLENQDRPVAVRSSSLFEDAFLQPFAGIYRTVMMPNTSPSLDERVEELAWAVRMVYASTFSQQARSP